MESSLCQIPRERQTELAVVLRKEVESNIYLNKLPLVPTATAVDRQQRTKEAIIGHDPD